MLDVGAVRFVLHPNAPFDQGVGAGVRPHRHRSVAPKSDQQTITERGDRAAAPAVRGERVLRAVVADLGVDLGTQQHASDRRRARREQQTVVAPRQWAADRTGGEAAQAVGDQPLARLRDGELAAQGAVELTRRHAAPLRLRLGRDLRA